MLATELASGDGTSLAGSKLNFVSFTPGTSFNLRSSGGRADERALLFHLLKDRVARDTGLMNLLQMGVGKNRRREMVGASSANWLRTASLLDQSGLGLGELRQWAIDLSPPPSGRLP